MHNEELTCDEYRDAELYHIKLNIPLTSRRVLPRKRLDLSLSSDLDSSLILVTAPIGFGKTTAVASWLRNTGMKAAWYSADSFDNDLKHFWSYFILSLNAVKPGISEEFSQFIYEADAIAAENIASTLVRELSEINEDFVIVIDDYHLLRDSSIQSSVLLFIKCAPKNAHVVIISRKDPQFSTRRIEPLCQIKKLDASDLRFTNEEIKALFLMQERILSPEEISSLETHTDGWATGLCLLLSAENRMDFANLPEANSDNVNTSYLISELIDSHSSEEISFMLRTSILTSLSGPLCNALTGQTDGSRMLKRLSERNAFIIPADGENIWYRYQSCFSALLQNRLKGSGLNVSALHARAGEWYVKNGLYAQALSHFIKSGLNDRAAVILETQGRNLLKIGDYCTLIFWLEKIPEEIIETSAVLSLMYAWSLLLTDRIEEAASRIGLIEKMSGEFPAVSGYLTETQLKGEIAAFRCFLGIKLSDPRLTLKSFNIFKKLSLENSIFLGYGLASSRGEASLLAGMFSFGGRLSLMEDEFAKIYGQIRDIQPQHLGFIPTLTGELLFERNKPDRAASYLSKGMEEAEKSKSAGILVPAVITKARMMIDSGCPDDAYKILDEGERSLHAMGSIHMLPLLQAFRTRLDIITGDSDSVKQWLDRNCLDVEEEPSLQRLYELTTLVRVLLYLDRTDDCVFLLSRLIAFTKSEHHLYCTAELLNLGAILCCYMGETQEALKMLNESLVIGESEGYLRIYIEEGQAMAILLERFLKWYYKQGTIFGKKLSPIYIRSLLQQTKSYCNQIKTFKNDRENSIFNHIVKPLTPRELEVLLLLNSDLSRAGIAEKLNIALNTVKVDCTSIYKKLNVKNREQAVYKAREMGLLNLGKSVYPQLALQY